MRHLAVLLLALALPVQGIAAVAKAQCMSYGHHQDAGHHEHEGHAHHGSGGDGHKKAPAQSKCGPCAACCAAALAATPAPRTSFDPVSASPCCNPSALASVSLDTPERPPLVG